MLLLHRMPRLEPIAANAAFRRFFYARWGVTNCIISARCNRAEYPPYLQRLSVKAAWGGAERYHVDTRSVAVDDDNYLILNDARRYASTIDSPEAVHSFSIFFRPGMPEEVFGTLTASTDRLLEDPEPPRRRIEFAERLRPHDRIVSPVLTAIRRGTDRGLDDETWYEEQLTRLLEAMLRSHRGTSEAVQRLGFSRVSTRREVCRRVGLAADFMQSRYADPIDIDDIAHAAHLSKYHFIRLFRAVYGVSPHTYLRAKRVSAARRLLATTALGVAEVARRAGFEHRTTLFRNLARSTGHSGRMLRARTCAQGAVP